MPGNRSISLRGVIAHGALLLLFGQTALAADASDVAPLPRGSSFLERVGRSPPRPAANRGRPPTSAPDRANDSGAVKQTLAALERLFRDRPAVASHGDRAGARELRLDQIAAVRAKIAAANPGSAVSIGQVAPVRLELPESTEAPLRLWFCQ